MKDVTNQWQNKTRDGTMVRFLSEFPEPSKGGYSIIGQRLCSDGWVVEMWLADGSQLGFGEHVHDILPNMRKVTKWVVVCEGGRVPGFYYATGPLYDSRKVAEELVCMANIGCLGVFPIEIEVPNDAD